VTDCRVVIRGAPCATLEAVRTLLVASGWPVHAPADPSTPQPGPAFTITVLSLANPGGAAPPELDAIREHSRHSFVICLGDGVSAWPLTYRCEPLIAGATDLVDRALPELGPRLHTRLTALHQREGARWRTAHDVGAVLDALGAVSVSAAMTAVLGSAVRLSRLSELPVLITGESGTGKELVARVLHALDPRRARHPLVAVNCAAISTDLFESELFGHRRGAFTGADRDRGGLVRAAHHGVLLLDEVGELSLAQQAKLLRLIQTQRVLGVGADADEPVDVRVVAATNRDLAAMTAAGTFREDLYHRLAVFPLHIPPLRERPDDIPPLVAHFLSTHAHLCRYSISAGSDFLAALGCARLPGNVREVENLVCQALAARDDDAPLGLGDLPRSLLATIETGTPAGAHRPSETELPPAEAVRSLADAMRAHERLIVEQAVQRAGGNQAHAARLLGITPRSVYNKLRKHGLQA
jgi:transcriptional regulator with GAF, ATPase, and Fis domain